MADTDSTPDTGRIVLLDVPGQPLALTLHDADGQIGAAVLEPLDALALAADLVASARRRLAGGAA
jgi:hypothetical protein